MTTNPDLLARARTLLAAITPGEWTAQQVEPRPGYETGYFTIYSYATPCICSVPGIQVDVFSRDDNSNLFADRQSANAAFIAASPALLRELVAAIEQRDAEIARLRAALANIVTLGDSVDVNDLQDCNEAVVDMMNIALAAQDAPYTVTGASDHDGS